MVASPLVEPLIRDGASVLKRLDDGEFPLSAAFWLYKSESELWDLTIASLLVDSLGPMECYRRVQELLSTAGLSVRLQHISLTSPQDPIVIAIQRVIKEPIGEEPIRLTGNTINGLYIEDAYIYRV